MVFTTQKRNPNGDRFMGLDKFYFLNGKILANFVQILIFLLKDQT